MLKEFGSERLIGMLHAYVLLRPVIEAGIRTREHAVLQYLDLSRYN
jgi:hypothetical protein